MVTDISNQKEHEVGQRRMIPVTIVASTPDTINSKARTCFLQRILRTDEYANKFSLVRHIQNDDFQNASHQGENLLLVEEHLAQHNDDVDADSFAEALGRIAAGSKIHKKAASSSLLVDMSVIVETDQSPLVFLQMFYREEADFHLDFYLDSVIAVVESTSLRHDLPLLFQSSERRSSDHITTAKKMDLALLESQLLSADSVVLVHDSLQHQGSPHVNDDDTTLEPSIMIRGIEQQLQSYHPVAKIHSIFVEKSDNTDVEDDKYRYSSFSSTSTLSFHDLLHTKSFALDSILCNLPASFAQRPVVAVENCTASTITANVEETTALPPLQDAQLLSSFSSSSSSSPSLSPGIVRIALDGELHFDLVSNWITDTLSAFGHHDTTTTDDDDDSILFRYQGVFAIKGHDQKYVFQGTGGGGGGGVGSRNSTTRRSRTESILLWTGGYSRTMRWNHEDRQSFLEIRGHNLDHDQLLQGLQACKVMSPLRFSVGTPVQAKMGSTKWEPGIVVATWDQGNAYRIQLKGSGAHVWALHDEDAWVRRKKPKREYGGRSTRQKKSSSQQQEHRRGRSAAAALSTTLLRPTVV